jgi:hypothetical protein
LGLEGNIKIDDLNVEGAINLINKVGKLMESKIIEQRERDSE